MNTRHMTTDTNLRRGGFTLVEMLVSVTLVLLMMSLFATIFQIAAGSTSKQRGISQNDQRARSVQTVLKGDFDKRTYRNVIPFFMGEDANVSPTRFGDRQGYLYISVNNSNDYLDDVLQFTVNADITVADPDVSPFFGRARQLHMGTFAEGAASAHINDLANNPNQPEADDGDINPNGTSSSPAAEVTYFVRNGKLYRRIMMLRNPLALAGQELQVQPSRPDDSNTAATGDTDAADENPLDWDESDATFDYYVSEGGKGSELRSIDASSGERYRTFWQDFDFSAFPSAYVTPATGVGPTVAQFNGLASLNNESTGSTFFSLGKPNYRFGFHVATGLPREHVQLPSTSVPNPDFIGRFLHEETSALNFGYPQGPSTVSPTDTTLLGSGGGGSSPTGDPMNTVNVQLTLDADKIVSEFATTTPVASGIRRSEELLLSNVHEFRVEIFDERMGQFTYPGHNQALPGADGVRGTGGDDIAGDYNAARRLNAGYGPLRGAGTNRVFDTWFPYDPATTPVTIGSNALPPFRAMTYYPPVGASSPTASLWTPSLPGATISDPPAYQTYSTEDANGNGQLDSGEDGTNGFPTNGVLDFDVVFAPTEDQNGNGILDAGEDGSNGFNLANGFNGPPYTGGETPVIDSHAGTSNSGFEYYYKCVRPGVAAIATSAGDAANGSGANNAPNWQQRPGALITENVPAGGPLPAIWQAVPNLRPLKAVRITVRFIDQSTQQMRQVTIEQSLVD